ncbi:hypothetical protein pdam_00011234 [Pocillopora damicornis]|uniref:Peptidase S1 domain-containing protein n=1 Tax=Pocillopora damicornis TaxID=46731 RepID=A0A3M6U6H2_POCDA|nr:hypothetical protein pdam_00011234 [Pocillopora damicornis]
MRSLGLGHGRNPANYRIVVGDHNRNVNEGTEESVGAAQIISHPQYNSPGRLNNDIALIKLATSVKLSARVNPVCLPSSDSNVPTGSKCYITGWGKIRHPGGSHPILQQAMMPPIDPAKCRQKIQASGVSIALTPQMLCAGVDNSILSGCHGDSGGPYVCLNADGKTYTLHGAVSWGSSRCDAKQLFTVFARVTQYRAWIKQHTGISGGGGPPPSPPIPTTSGCGGSPPPPSTPPPVIFEKSVYVQNIRRSQRDTRYKPNTIPSTPACSNYKVLNERDRITTYKGSVKCDSSLGKGWYRFAGDAGTQMPTKCVPKLQCGTHAPGWLSGAHPTVGEGAVQRKVCFHWSSGCCQWSSNILVRNCGGFFVYELDRPPACSLRYCGEKTQGCSSSTPPPPGPTTPVNAQECSSYQVLKDFDRAKGFQGGAAKCDRSGFVKAWYKFEGGAGDKMPDACVPTNRCGTHAPGWLSDGHPAVADGAASRKVCFHWSGNCCRWSRNVRVRNCGNFYVYELPPTEYCSLRYCGNRERATPIPPTGPPPSPGVCGVRPHSRIVGGVNAKHGDWPWQVQLRTPGGFPYCGGSLVHPEWIVTATHCIEGKSPNSIVIRLGAHRRVNVVGTEQDIRVSKVIPHPQYHQPKRYSNDIALLKLERPAQLNRYVNLVCLPQSVPAPTDGTRCWITGWGRLASGGATPDYLQQVQVPVVSYARCNRAYPGKIHDSMICAGLDQGGIDSCQGDSGGPMVCETGGRFYLHGATSWGYGCASPGKFGVYAKVKYELNWLNSEMSKN